MLLRLTSSLLLLLGLTTTAPIAFAAPKKSAPTRPDFKGYIVIDAATGDTLDERNPDVVTPPASVTKLMTFLVVHDALAAGQLTLDTPVRVSVAASKMGGTQVHLDPRETFTVRAMLQALMIQSANDCAYALAEAVAGTRDAFVERMNTRARQLGMTRTTFTSPHGLPPSDRKLANGDLTTPRDLALLSRELLLSTDVLTHTSIRKMNFGEGSRPEPMVMENHNKLLGKVAGVDGLKTGYTQGAGYCLAATAQRNNRRLIIVIMGALGSGGEVDHGKSRDFKTVELIEANFPKIPAASHFIPHSGTATQSPITALTPTTITPAPPSPNWPNPPSPITPAAAETAPSPTPSDISATPTAPAQLEAPKIQFKLPSSTKSAK